MTDKIPSLSNIIHGYQAPALVNLDKPLSPGVELTTSRFAVLRPAKVDNGAKSYVLPHVPPMRQRYACERCGRDDLDSNDLGGHRASVYCVSQRIFKFGYAMTVLGQETIGAAEDTIRLFNEAHGYKPEYRLDLHDCNQLYVVFKGTAWTRWLSCLPNLGPLCRELDDYFKILPFPPAHATFPETSTTPPQAYLRSSLSLRPPSTLSCDASSSALQEAPNSPMSASVTVEGTPVTSPLPVRVCEVDGCTTVIRGKQPWVALNRHRNRAHSKGADYMCGLEGCRLTFPGTQHLGIHQATHPPGSMLRCPYGCADSARRKSTGIFKSRSSFSKHMWAVHPRH